MIGTNDVDRLLAEYLEDGPRRAPERPVDTAIAFARRHPRRGDPLLFLRRDVMPSRTPAWSPQLAWVLVVLGLALALVAVVAVGSRRDDRSVLPPPPAVDVSPSPSAAPTPREFSVELIDSHGVARTVSVIDASLAIVSVEAGPPADGEPVDEIAATNDPADPSRVRITWPYDSCADPVTLTVDPNGTSLRLERPVCNGDAIGGNDLQVTLVFADPVNATELDVELVETP